MRTLIITCLALLLAPVAQAQYVDCSQGCSSTFYGFGNEAFFGDANGNFNNSRFHLKVFPADGSCGPEIDTRILGQLRIREQDTCIASSTTRCRVEMPQVPNESGWANAFQDVLSAGPLGLVAVISNLYQDLGGNQGNRQLSGTCGISGDDCALDAECDARNAGDVCRSSCFSDPGIACSSEDDAACPNLDCRTEIDWDGIGLCTDRATLCTSDADCPGGNICQPGFVKSVSDDSCACCQSESGVLCAILAGWTEYPDVVCPVTSTVNPHGVGTSHWLFDGGRGTRFEMDIIQVPGQQEGVCNQNRSRSCGVLGDFWSGSRNDKCAGAPPCFDPFDVDNPALVSTCDDVAFGGLAGDFCDFTEKGPRTGDLNPDGTQDITVCAQIQADLVGTPNELCHLPVVLPTGDPQPGCAVINLGIVSQPDLDCNGIDDTTEGRCMPMGGVSCSDTALCPPCAADNECASGVCINNGDLCPFVGELNHFLDSNNDDIGDECQCGDGTGDGAITGLDIAATALCANGAAVCDSTLVDATGDNSTTAEDIGGVVAAVNGAIQTGDLQCIRSTDTSQ